MEQKLARVFEAIQQNFIRDSLPLGNYAGLSVDNTNSLAGVQNPVGSRFLQKNPRMSISVCPCHLANIAASNANDGFSDMIGLNTKIFCIDAFNWLKRSSKRKEKFAEQFEFWDQKYHNAFKHRSTYIMKVFVDNDVWKEIPNFQV